MNRGGGRPIKVFCADDDARFRSVLRQLIELSPDFRLLGEAASGEDALAWVVLLRPDLVLLDVRMPGIGGIEVARKLRVSQPDLAVALMSAERPAPPSATDTQDPKIVFVAKELLSPELLLDLWRRSQSKTIP